MPNYRRAWNPGGTYFFTVNLLQRQGNSLLAAHIELLRETVRAVRQRHPFEIHVWIVLPDHLHCVMELPRGDADFAVRGRLIKAGFSKGLPKTEWRSAVRTARGERGICQRRYWEHLIDRERETAMTKNSNESDRRGANKPTPMRLVAAKIFRWISFAFLGLCTLTAQAAGEWIDEFPNVTVVARAVSDQLKADTAGWNFSARGIALKDDDDLFSVYMAGTLVMLRQIVLYKYEQEEMSLSTGDVEKLRSLVASYLEAELVIGKGTGSRRGYLTTAQKCRDMDCHKRWFKMHYMSVNGAAYRERILPRMFCDDVLTTELITLALSKGLKAPYLPSPATTLQVEGSMAGVAPAGCSIYGGDKDNNGLCDDWRPPEALSATSSNSVSCLPINRPNQPVFSGGVRAASNRWVEIKTGVSGRQGDECSKVEKKIKGCDGKVIEYNGPSGGGCGINDGISIRVKCADGHVVQFISREYRLRGKADTDELPGNLEGGHYATGPYTADRDDTDVMVATCHPKTTSLRNRSWRTDSQVKSNPYYESGGSYTRSPRCMTTFDAPNVASFDPQKYLVVRIVGKSFAVCGCKVVSVVDWERTYYAAAPKVGVYEVKPPRDPNPGEVEQFQAEAGDEGFAAWPSAECDKCQQ